VTFADIPSGSSVFLDANILVYHFVPDPVFGPLCRDLLDRISQREVSGLTSSHVLTNVAHRLMTIEATAKFGWPMKGIAYRLQQRPADLQTLTDFRQSVEDVPTFGVQVLSVQLSHVVSAAELSQQHGLLSGDALLVAVMQSHGLTHLASHDADFDRVPGFTRYVPA
jgi:predicted nucleic acid-binding protein